MNSALKLAGVSPQASVEYNRVRIVDPTCSVVKSKPGMEAGTQEAIVACQLIIQKLAEEEPEGADTTLASHEEWLVSTVKHWEATGVEKVPRA